MTVSKLQKFIYSLSVEASGNMDGFNVCNKKAWSPSEEITFNMKDIPFNTTSGHQLKLQDLTILYILIIAIFFSAVKRV